MNKGKEFEKQVQDYLNKRFNGEFKQITNDNNEIKIGCPANSHCFDLISEDLQIIIECKSYNWRKNLKIPSAKISTLNEAVLYFQHLNPPYNKYSKILFMKQTHAIKNKGTLAQYYVNHYGHLLDDVEVMELSVSNKIKVIKGEHFKQFEEG